MKRMKFLAAVLTAATVFTSAAVPQVTAQAEQYAIQTPGQRIARIQEDVKHLTSNSKKIRNDIAELKKYQKYDKITASEKKKAQKRLNDLKVIYKENKRKLNTSKHRIDAINYGISASVTTGPAIGAGTEQGAANPLSPDLIEGMMFDIFRNEPYDKNIRERKDTVYSALFLTGRNNYKFGGMHKIFNAGRGYIADYSDFADADDSGFVSYCLFKGNARGYKSDKAVSNEQLSKTGRKVNSKKLRPGDILVKINPVSSRNKKYQTHSVMYLGKTVFGDFTIVECAVNNKISGVQIRGYRNFGDFTKSKGKYDNLRDPYTAS